MYRSHEMPISHVPSLGAEASGCHSGMPIFLHGPGVHFQFPDMADTLSFQQEISKFIERVATDMEMFFLLSSFVAIDAFLYSFDKQHRTLISFDWSFAHAFDIGAIQIFFPCFRSS
jgi:hypothetical protein